MHAGAIFILFFVSLIFEQTDTVDESWDNTSWWWTCLLQRHLCIWFSFSGIS